MQELETISKKIERLQGATNPHIIADLKTELAQDKVWLGERMVEAEMIFNDDLNSIMIDEDISAVSATIKAKTLQGYKNLLKFKQYYKDLTTVISAANSKLKILEREWGETRYGG